MDSCGRYELEFGEKKWKYFPGVIQYMTLVHRTSLPKLEPVWFTTNFSITNLKQPKLTTIKVEKLVKKI